jgi:HlyD family secretion protein
MNAGARGGIGRRQLLLGGAVLLTAAVVYLVVRPRSVAVQTAVVDRGAVRVTVDEDGETRVRDRYVVAAPITGRLERLSCEAGDSVHAGDVVARIYPLPLDTRAATEGVERLRAAEAARRAAEARVAQADAVWGEARRALERLRGVAAEVPGAIAPQRLDEAETRERSAASELQQARDAAAAAGHDVQAARAALLGSAEGGSAEPTEVEAPVGGRVLRLYEECERAITAGSPILELGDPADLEIVVDVLTEDAARLRVGARARITTGPEADTLVGRIRRIEPSAFTKVSPLGVEEQRVNVIVGFDGGRVLPGDRYRVEASLVAWEAEDVLRVPVSALFRVDGDWVVYRLEDGRAKIRRVDLGHRGRRMAEVAGGLAAGDRVVLYPSDAVREGSRVRADEG